MSNDVWMGFRRVVAIAAIPAMFGSAACSSARAVPVHPNGAARALVVTPDRAGDYGPGTSCSEVTTAAGVTATTGIVHGKLSCATVVRVFRDYYSALAQGRAPGNGGGGPVVVDGWTCSSTPAIGTPVSTCDSEAKEIMARAKN